MSDEKANVTTIFNTEITSSALKDFNTFSMGCMISDFINCIATETSEARAERAEQACSTWKKRDTILIMNLNGIKVHH